MLRFLSFKYPTSLFGMNPVAVPPRLFTLGFVKLNVQLFFFSGASSLRNIHCHGVCQSLKKFHSAAVESFQFSKGPYSRLRYLYKYILYLYTAPRCCTTSSLTWTSRGCLHLANYLPLIFTKRHRHYVFKSRVQSRVRVFRAAAALLHWPT